VSAATPHAPVLYGGVETGGTWCVCAVGSGPQTIAQRAQIRTQGPSETVAAIAEFFACAPEVAAVGVGSFGPLELDPSSDDWGVLKRTPKPGWSGFPLARELKDRLERPLVLDTDVSAAALGEQRWGAAAGVRSACYMTVGTGVGVGLILGGEPWHGIVHPEVGHIRVPHDTSLDPFAGICPYHGDCLEGLASGPALAARWGRPPEELEPEHPAWALEAAYIAQALETLVLTIGPERIVLGGGVLGQVALLPLVRARLGELLGAYLDVPALESGLERFVVPAALGDDAGVLGAIALAERRTKAGS